MLAGKITKLAPRSPFGLAVICRAIPTGSIDSLAPALSPFGLSVYLAQSPLARFMEIIVAEKFVTARAP